MKVTAFNGSPLQEGNTALLIGHIFEALNKEGIKTMRDLGENMPWLLKRIAE